MKSLKALFLLALLVAALAIAVSQESSSLEGPNHRLLRERQHQHHHHKAMTCDKYPRICRAPGSNGPDCCKKKCVNVSRDRNNCGKCGRKCKYSQICCRGKCVNPMVSNNHCGTCGNKCNNGDSCNYGICSYA
ncbi:stigma-specific STIG1-like protein 1 [Prosopis cineraria]|uniref:stigma-specific STIG1-like protein 1 n=1 Tax=Prosopis cineraria TaxID=364024 RepID=UPI00241097C5|nr:stigma-specific STIG1-like protein 1 [Prosopis cineraria]